MFVSVQGKSCPKVNLALFLLQEGTHVPGLPVNPTFGWLASPSHTSTARVAPEVLERTWNRRVFAGAVWPPSLEVPPL